MKISNMHKLVSFAGFCSLLLMFSCTGKSSGTATDAPSKTVCALQENIAPVGRPMSFAMNDDGSFVLTDLKSVYLYSAGGEQLKQIGRSGRARYEYLTPLSVKIQNDTVYVWSAGSLEFIAYTMDGEPVAEYPYRSAIKDFLPAGDSIYIYTAGNADENIVDVYDTKKGEVVQSIGKSTTEHRVLLHAAYPAPVCLKDGNVYFAAKDALTVYRYDPASGKTSPAAELKSDSFRVEKLQDNSSLESGSEKRSDYLWSNSQSLFLFADKDRLMLMSIGGELVQDGENTDYSDRLYSLYDVAGNRCVATYTNASIGASPLFSSNSDGLYFLKLSNDETQPHTLRKLIL